METRQGDEATQYNETFHYFSRVYWYWIFAWVVLSVIAAFAGRQKRIGFMGALITSLLLTPITGFILVSLSKAKSPEGERESQIDNKNTRE